MRNIQQQKDSITCQDINDFTARVKQLYAIKPSSSNPLSRNPIMYQLYVDLERSLLTLEQQDNLGEKDGELIGKLEELRSSLKLDHVVKSSFSFTRLLFSLPRVFIYVWTILLGGILILLLIPLRWMHPFLRRYVGIPNNYLPMDLLVRLYCRCICTAAGIHVTTELSFSEKRIEPTLIMFSHASNMDGLCILTSCPFYCKFIGKAVIFLVPIFGWAAYAIGTQPISRSNRKKAVKDLHALQQKYQVHKRSLAISPEGTRSKTGILAAFKKGPFYLWQDCGHVSITPAIIFGGYELWPPGAFFPSSGRVFVRYCEPITIHQSNGNNTNDKINGVEDHNDNAASILREKARITTRNSMLEEYTKNYPELAGTSLFSGMSLSDLLMFGLEYLLLIFCLVFFTRFLVFVWIHIWQGWSLQAQTGIVIIFTLISDLLIYLLVIL